MVEIVNLTNHKVTILDEKNNKKVEFDPHQGPPARCATDTTEVTQIAYDGEQIPLTKTKMSEVLNLPDPKENTIYIVSLIVAAVADDSRNDLVIPDDLVRNERGHVIGCRSLSFYKNGVKNYDEW